MPPTSEQARLVANLKASAHDMSIPIISRAGINVGALSPVTFRLAEEPPIIDALYRWRRSHMTAFLTVFTPTLEKTRRYLTHFSLADIARVLFLATDSNGRHVGHIGLCNITAHGAEIDNVIRGESVAIADFMVYAQAALLRWAFPSLDIPLAYLNVLGDNSRAIRTYEKVGLRAVGCAALAREEHEEGYRLKPATASDANAGLMLVKMEISRETFLANDRDRTVAISTI